MIERSIKASDLPNDINGLPKSMQSHAAPHETPCASQHVAVRKGPLPAALHPDRIGRKISIRPEKFGRKISIGGPDMEKIVTYYRVSTDAQGRSGLGLEAQRTAVERYLAGSDYRTVAEFTEVESGKRSDRPELDKAMRAAKLHRATLVVAKLDRLSRNVAFLSRLIETNISLRCADLPQIEGATGRFLLHQMAAVAELEAGMISARTKAALSAAKARGTKLGGCRHLADGKLTAVSSEARQRAAEAVQRRASIFAAEIAPTIQTLQAGGAGSLRAIANGLNEAGIPAPRAGYWSAGQVGRVLARLEANS